MHKCVYVASRSRMYFRITTELDELSFNLLISSDNRISQTMVSYTPNRTDKDKCVGSIIVESDALLQDS
jgi:hypothetical protein